VSIVLWPILVYFGAVLLIVSGMLVVSYLLGQRHREHGTVEPYESGIASTGSATLRFDASFYLVAMFFVIFDLESMFLFAWAAAIRETGWQGYADVVEVTVERGGGLIARVRATLGPVSPVGAGSPSYTANIRLIPSAEAGAPPSVSELVRVSNTLFVHEMRTAEASLEFGPTADTEAWSALPVRRVLSAGLAVSDFTLNYGTVLARYAGQRPAAAQ
jgi:NADH-quinone oxidoreductase subunit A